MIDEKNKDKQNNPSTGNFGGGDNKTSGASGASGASTQSAKDNFSAPNNTAGSGGLNVDSAKETAKGLIDQAKSTAGQAYGVAAEKATTKIEEKKTDLASGLTTVADTIRQVSSTLKETDEQTGITDTAAKYSDSLAQQVEQISKYFERNDVRAMIGDVEDFARRNPAVFIGGAFALGLLAARFLKSSNPGQGSTRKFKNQNYGGNKLLKARNDSTQLSDFGKTNLSTGGKPASEGITGIDEKSSTGSTKSGTANTSPGATGYNSASSNLGTGSTGFGSGSAGNKSTSDDKTNTNPS
jgi:hypothetical protein